MAELKQQMPQVVLDGEGQNDDELQTPTNNATASEPNASEDKRDLWWNCDKSLVKKVILFSAIGLAGLTLLNVLICQFLGLTAGWLVVSFVLALVSSWLWGIHLILSPSKGKLYTQPKL